MKLFLSISTLLCVRLLFAQYGQEGAIIVAAEGVIRATELTQYNKIAKIQEDILGYQGVVMVMTAELTRIEQLGLESEKKVPLWLEGLNSTVEIGLKAQQLLELQIEINNIIADVPILAPILGEAMAGIVQESIVIVSDQSIAIKESRENLMPPKDRIDILTMATNGLDHLIGRSAKILLLARQLANLTELENLGTGPRTFDLSRPTNDIIVDIENMID